MPSPLPFSITMRPVTGPPIDITADAEDVEFAEEIPGGYASCSFWLPRNPGVWHRELIPWSDIEITDGDENIYTGRVEPTGWDAGPGDARARIEAYGWQQHGSDDTYRGIIKDRRFDQLRQRRRGSQSDTFDAISLETVDDATNGNQLNVNVPVQIEASIASGARYELVYTIPSTWPRHEISRLFFRWVATTADTSLSFRIETQTGTNVYNTNHTTSAQTVNLTTLGTDSQSFILQPVYANSAVAAFNDPKIVKIWGLQIYGTKYQVDPTSSSLVASSIVDEVLKAVCPKFDRNFIIATTPGVDPLIYPDPTDPKQVFDEMLAFAPTNVTDSPWYWAVYEKLPTGLYKFVFDALPDAVAYEATLAGGAHLSNVQYDPAQQFNKAIVQYYDERGVLQEVSRTQTIDALADLGVTRTTVVGPLQIGETTQAQRIGDILLQENRLPSRSATLEVEGDMVRDAKSGAQIPFWRLRAGKRIRIPDFQVNGGPTLSPKDEDNTFLIRRIEKNMSDRRATLTLDAPTSSAENLIARLSR